MPGEMHRATCPLCQGQQITDYHADRRRQYWQCSRCKLVFVPPEFHLSPAEEKAEYDLHDNDVSDPGYRRFLSRLAEPLAAKLSPGAKGLDYGAGPGPLLRQMLTEQGFPCQGYDPFYAPDTYLLQQQYDFISCSEAIEHFHQPHLEWARWLTMLKPGGWLGIMTKRVRDQQAFATWHYKNDLTHVCFFSRQTFEFLAARDRLSVEFVSPDVVLLHKQ